MPKSIKITLDDRDGLRLQDIASDMNIPALAILAKKFVLDGIKKYIAANPGILDAEREREVLEQRAEQETEVASA